MKLIIDCGSTKADWVILNGEEVVSKFQTEGFNPNYTDKNTILSIKETQEEHNENIYKERFFDKEKELSVVTIR